MARVFITGSADGLGKLAAQRLAASGHQVIVHARNKERLLEALRAVPDAEAGVAGDLSSLVEMRGVAEGVNSIGAVDAVIHNAAVGFREDRRTTVDGLPHVFAINSLAPYVLTCLIGRPRRLIYLSSGLHTSGDPDLSDLLWERRRWNGMQAYSDSKLHDLLLALAVARRWKDVRSNALEPGWVPTKMGGPNAPDSIDQGSETQAWLAVSDEDAAQVSGQYFYHKRPKAHSRTAGDPLLQDAFLARCAALSGVTMPAD